MILVTHTNIRSQQAMTTDSTDILPSPIAMPDFKGLVG